MIRKLEQKDKENWAKLYNGYARFLQSPNEYWGFRHSLEGGFMMKAMMLMVLCFELEGKIVGIAHYRTMPRPIKGQYIGFLDDLFVEPEF